MNGRLDDFVGARIAVIGGGRGPEREGSIASATAVLDALIDHGVHAHYVDLADVAGDDLARFDLAVVLAHGLWGEDGRLQGHLETLGVAYTGSPPLASAISMNKAIANVHAAGAGLRVPTTVEIATDATEQEIASAISPLGDDIVVRPVDGGGSLGVLRAAVAREIHAHLGVWRGVFARFLVSPFVHGTEVSVALARHESRMLRLPVLATYHAGALYDYAIKHDDRSRKHVCPADIPVDSKDVMLAACERL